MVNPIVLTDEDVERIAIALGRSVRNPWPSYPPGCDCSHCGHYHPIRPWLPPPNPAYWPPAPYWRWDPSRAPRYGTYTTTTGD